MRKRNRNVGIYNNLLSIFIKQHKLLFIIKRDAALPENINYDSLAFRPHIYSGAGKVYQFVLLVKVLAGMYLRTGIDIRKNRVWGYVLGDDPLQ